MGEGGVWGAWTASHTQHHTRLSWIPHPTPSLHLSTGYQCTTCGLSLTELTSTRGGTWHLKCFVKERLYVKEVTPAPPGPDGAARTSTRHVKIPEPYLKCDGCLADAKAWLLHYGVPQQLVDHPACLRAAFSFLVFCPAPQCASQPYHLHSGVCRYSGEQGPVFDCE